VINKSIKRGVKFSLDVLSRETSVDVKNHFWSFLGAFIGISLISLAQIQLLTRVENIFLIASFGASSVLIYGAVESPLAQPRNFIFGPLISAIIGVTVYKMLPNTIWLSAPLAVSLSLVAMQITKTLHPPGGATALITVIGTEKVKALGYFFVLTPVLTGTLILFVVALIFNNLTTHRRYPRSGTLADPIRRLFVRDKIKDKD